MPKKQYLILTTGIITSWGCLNRWLSAMWCFSLSVCHMGEIVPRPSWIWFHFEIKYFKMCQWLLINLIIPNFYSSRARWSSPIEPAAPRRFLQWNIRWNPYRTKKDLARWGRSGGQMDGSSSIRYYMRVSPSQGAYRFLCSLPCGSQISILE